MVSIHNIRSIARYETKTLLRSWFFRIFAIIAMVFLFFFNFGVLIESNGGSGEWWLKGLPSNIPYANILFLNVVQAVIAIFLASDFLKRDKKLDTTEVIYMRPMTNGEYVIGKTLGNLLVFVVLNFIILGIALIFNFIAKDTAVYWHNYLYYFLIISLPTLIFIMGLAFLVMSLIRNQAVTFVVLLGYVAITLFYITNNFYYLFDYMAFNIPLIYSDFVGFGNLKTILIHRGMYLGFGLAFICFAILLLRRLPHSEIMRWLSSVFGAIFFFGALYLGFLHVNSFTENKKLKEQMVSVNDEYLGTKQVAVRSYNIDLDHQGNSIACEVNMQVKNTRQEPIENVIFSLNPGLQISSISVNGDAQKFERDHGIIELSDCRIAPGEQAKIVMNYQGCINETACFLDIDDKIKSEAYRAQMFQIDKRHAFITPTYVLLTRESNWYPIPGAGLGYKNKQWFSRQFSNYKLNVKTLPGLIPVSQGSMDKTEEGFVFESSHAQSQISLSIGKYQQISKEVDGLEFNVFCLEGHDYFSSFFEDVKDTIPGVIAEVLQDFERDVDLFYPFERLSLVEVPIQFYAYERLLTGARENLQPEMILFPEKGLMIRNADFNGRFHSRRGFGRGDNENLTPEEKKIRVLRNFLSTFTMEQGRPNFNRSQGELQVEDRVNTNYAFPLFYNYAYYISSDEWLVIDRVFESYKKQSTTNPRYSFARDLQGLSEDEKGNLALLSQSFEEILLDPEQAQIADNVIKLKGKTLFSIVKHKAKDDEFEDFLYAYLNGVKFQTSTIEQFNDALFDEFEIDLIPYLKNWFKSKELPAFLFGKNEAKKVLDGDQLKTMFKIKVTNTEDVEGVLSFNFRIGGGGGRFGGMGGSAETVTELLYLEGNQTKEVSFLLNGNPRGVSINSLASKNIPAEIRIVFDNLEEDKDAVPYEGEKVLDDPVTLVEEHEIILDNEDPSFEVTEGYEESLLRKLLIKEKAEKEKYSGFFDWRPPRQWTLTTKSSFYGKTFVRLIT